MKKIIVFFSLFCLTAYAQETEKKWRVFNGFDMYYTSFVNVGNNMTQDAHRNYGGGFGFKLSAVEYKNIGFSLFYNYTKHSINDIDMIADFEYTKYNESGMILSYRLPLTEKTILKPEIGYYGTDAKDRSEGREAVYGGKGFLIGADYMFFAAHKFAFIGGIHYNYTRLRVEANSAYKDYFANAHRIQFKIGIHFGR